MPLQARLDMSGALHHVMVRGIDKMSIFKDNGDKEKFLQRLGENINKESAFVSVLPGGYNTSLPLKKV